MPDTVSPAYTYLPDDWDVHLLAHTVWLAGCQREADAPVLEHATNWGLTYLGRN